MEEKAILLLALLNVAHWAGDYTVLSRPSMLAAKRFGTPLHPILAHAWVHAGLFGVVILLFKPTIEHWYQAIIIEAATHFVIDVTKGKINKWFPSVQNTATYTHWCIFGADQFMHQIVIILIAYLVL